MGEQSFKIGFFRESGWKSQASEGTNFQPFRELRKQDVGRRKNFEIEPWARLTPNDDKLSMEKWRFQMEIFENADRKKINKK